MLKRSILFKKNNLPLRQIETVERPFLFLALRTKLILVQYPYDLSHVLTPAPGADKVERIFVQN